MFRNLIIRGRLAGYEWGGVCRNDAQLISNNPFAALPEKREDSDDSSPRTIISYCIDYDDKIDFITFEADSPDSPDVKARITSPVHTPPLCPPAAEWLHEPYHIRHPSLCLYNHTGAL
jgi:hypothetical protein